MSKTIIKKAISGIILLDKAPNISSNKALQTIKHLLYAKKAGHTGNLDPFATGLLPLCFGEATKFSSVLLDSDKSYLVTAKLGECTDTMDKDGQVTAVLPVPNYDFDSINSALTSFLGMQAQLPPMYSALKHQGQPLYKLARQGIEILRQPRQIIIYSIILHSVNLPYCNFTVDCSKGTYIRSLVADLGKLLNCGAHVTELRRLKVADFTIAAAITAEKLQQLLSDDPQAINNILLPVDAALSKLPFIILDATAAVALQQGRVVAANNSSSAVTSGLVRLYLGELQQFIGIGEIHPDGLIYPKRMLDCGCF